MDFRLAYEIYKVAYNQRLTHVVDRERLLTGSTLDEAKSVVLALQERQEFDLARKLCKECDLDMDQVTLCQVSDIIYDLC